MSFIKEFNAYFFRGNAPINPNVPGDHKDNLATEGVPSQDTMERLMASKLSFKETTDRAKQSTGAELDEDLVGHVQIETDANIKTWLSGITTTLTTKVVHAGQLPDVNSDDQTLSSLNGVTNDAQAPAANIETITSTVNPAQLLRNDFLLRTSAAFVTWLNGIVGNLTEINTYTYGTGGQDNPAENGTGLGGVIYGPGGTAATPTEPGILTTLYGPTGVPTASSSLLPIGSTIQWVIPAAPNTNWKVCDGSAISRTTYADLFALMGVGFGIGDGATTFNLPDMRSKFVAGYSGAGDYTIDLNTVVKGEDTHVLTEAETPVKAHTHGSINLTVTGSIALSGDHQHKIASVDASAGGDDADITNAYETKATGGWNNRHHWTGQPNATIGGGADTALNANVQGDFLPDGGHTHTDTYNVGGNTDSANDATAAAHENRPNFIVMNHIIKVL